MKNIIFSILFIPLIGLSQNTTHYKEFNCGIYSGENIYVFPGASFLWGRTKYDTNNLVIDYQFGLALPTLVTGKVGVGIGNKNNAGVIGLRPWPPAGYLQYMKNERFVLSIEATPIENSGFLLPFPLIFNIGFRW